MTVTIHERGNGCCYPMSDDKHAQTYCGEPVALFRADGMWQYCDTHKAIMGASGTGYHAKSVVQAIHRVRNVA